MGQFNLKYVDFVEEEYDRSTKEPPRVDSALEQNETPPFDSTERKKNPKNRQIEYDIPSWTPPIELGRIC